MAATLSPTDKQPIKTNAERNGDAEIDPLSTVDFEEREVYGQSVPVLQNEDRDSERSGSENYECLRWLRRLVPYCWSFVEFSFIFAGRDDQLFSGFLTDGSRGRPSKRSPMMFRCT